MLSNWEILELERARVAREETEAAQAAYDALPRIEKLKMWASRQVAQLRGLAGANPYASLPIFIDSSHWNGTAINWAALKGRIICVVHKVGEVDDASDLNDRWNDSAFQTNFGGSAGAGIPSLGYFFDDGGAYAINHNWSMDERTYTPIWNDPKIDVLVRQLAYNPQWVPDESIEGGQRLTVNGWRPVRSIVIDVERHWQSYSEYGKFLRGEVTSYKKLSSAWIAFSFRLLVDRLQYMMNRGIMKRMPIMVYTRKSFLTQYSPDLATLLSNRKEILKWAAHYVVGSGNVSTTLEEIRAKYVPAETFRHLEIYGPSTFWQWSGDRYRIPEFGSGAVDLNFFMGTEELFVSLFGEVAPGPDPEPDPDPEDPPADLTEVNQRLDDLEAWCDALNTQLTALQAAPVKDHKHTPGGVQS